MLAITAVGSATGEDLSLARQRNHDRALRYLDYEEPNPPVPVFAELAVDESAAAADGTVAAKVAIEVDVDGASATPTRWLISLIATVVDSEPVEIHDTVEWNGADVAGWAYRAELRLPVDFQDAAVVVEELGSGRWGGSLTELAGELSQPSAGYVLVPGQTAPAVAQPTAAASAQKAVRETIIQIVRPREQPVTGRVRVRTLVTTESVRSAVFFLDGERVGQDDREPFSTVIDFGGEVRPRTIRVEALDRAGLLLGEDSLELNRDAQPFRIRIAELADGGDGETTVNAELSVPPQETLNRVEFYRNDELVTTRTVPPYTANVAAGTGPADYVRVVAHLASGETQEDARLFLDQGLSERVEVNLVEVYAVVTDGSGRPVQNLTREQFELKQGRKSIPVDRFALAAEVPLVLGLIVDSSQSMWPMMVETKQAAAQFLTATMEPDDRAFLVDFDTQPRLAQSLTDDAGTLLASLQRLQAGGNTALYDSVVFSMAQFEHQPGRRALVLLTDGADYGSRFSSKRCLAEARRLGVPVYVITMTNVGYLPGAWQQRAQQAPPANAFLEAMSDGSGARLFSITDVSQLGEVYRTIETELRSQYLLSFSTDQPLSEKELAALEAEVDVKGYSVRTVSLSR